MKTLKYLVGFTVPLSAILAFHYGGLLSYLTLAYAFGLVPLLELFTPNDAKNMSEAEESLAGKDRIYDFMIYSQVIFQYLLLFLFFERVSGGGLATWEITGMVLSMGICCGALGINVAHELGHRKKNYEQWMSKALLLTSLYMHFFIEHNRGHHKNVSTELDPASAAKGQNLYSFLPQSIFGSYLSAWKIEARLLKKKGKATLSVHNEMIWYQALQLCFVLLIGFVYGWMIALLFIAAAFVGILLLEIINYVEHYGLRRKELAPGKYERVLPVHSWNSDHILGRLLLYELTRHSDHHYLASRKYQLLRHFDESPQMPAGYPAMVILALFPPLWFSVMDKRVDAVSGLMIHSGRGRTLTNS